jgi:hypothetical protein
MGKHRVAYTPLGPYIASQYEGGRSYGDISRELGIPKGGVQNLCRTMGVTPRENKGTSNPGLWEQRLEEYLNRTGSWVIRRPKVLKKSSRVLIGCPHGSRETPCQVLDSMSHCCRSSAHSGPNNSQFGKKSWNYGTVGVSTGHGYGYGIDPQKWDHTDTLYLVTVVSTSGDLHYKIGRSFYGPRKRLQRSLVKVIGEWQGPHWLVWLTEQTLLKKHSGSCSRPIPVLASTGGTECFSDELDIGAVVSYCDFLFAPAIG